MVSYTGDHGYEILKCTNGSLMGRWVVNGTIDGTGMGRVMGRSKWKMGRKKFIPLKINITK